MPRKSHQISTYEMLVSERQLSAVEEKNSILDDSFYLNRERTSTLNGKESKASDQMGSYQELTTPNKGENVLEEL